MGGDDLAKMIGDGDSLGAALCLGDGNLVLRLDELERFSMSVSCRDVGGL